MVLFIVDNPRGLWHNQPHKGSNPKKIMEGPMSNLKKVLILYGLIVFAVNIFIISSTAHAIVVYVDKADVLKTPPKPNIDCGEPGTDPNGRWIGACSSQLDEEPDQAVVPVNAPKQGTEQYKRIIRSYLLFILKNLIWRT
jgi:hypothetical protein